MVLLYGVQVSIRVSSGLQPERTDTPTRLETFHSFTHTVLNLVLQVVKQGVVCVLKVLKHVVMGALLVS